MHEMSKWLSGQMMESIRPKLPPSLFSWKSSHEEWLKELGFLAWSKGGSGKT